jgi:hypothetical protein
VLSGSSPEMRGEPSGYSGRRQPRGQGGDVAPRFFCDEEEVQRPARCRNRQPDPEAAHGGRENRDQKAERSCKAHILEPCRTK